MNQLKTLIQTHTTAQAVAELRKWYNDKDIIYIAKDCSRGVYDAVSSIINKEVSSNSYGTENREKNEYEDGHDYE